MQVRRPVFTVGANIYIMGIIATQQAMGSLVFTELYKKTHSFLLYSRCVSFPSNSATPDGCPTIQFSSDAVSPELVFCPMKLP